MVVDQQPRGRMEIHIENVGGIDEADHEFTPGVTILEGRNATNRTSILRAIMAATGSDDFSLKGDADQGFVSLSFGGETYSRSIERTDDGVQTEGDPYLDDPRGSELFAFLLERNEARLAVAQGNDLQEIISRPIDTEEIEAEIDRLVRRREELEAELEEIDSSKRRLQELEGERVRLRNEIAEQRSDLEEKRSRLNEIDADVEEKAEEKDRFESKLDELRERHSTLDEVRYELETERESLEEFENEMAEIEEERADITEDPASELAQVESAIERLRERKQSIETELSDLQRFVDFSEEMLVSAHELPAALDDNDDRTVPDKLLEADRTTCWTCGSEVDVEQVRGTIDTFKEERRAKLDTKREIQQELDDKKEKRRSLEGKRQRREQLQSRLAQVEEQIDERKSRIEQLEGRRDELVEEIEEIESEVEDFDNDSFSNVLQLHKELTQMEYDLGRLEGDYDRIKDEVASIEDRLEERDAIEAERDATREEIIGLRTKIEQITESAVENFNEHMDNLLDLLEYDNVERVWLERIERNARDGPRTVTKSSIELHVVRSSDSGVTYEDTVDHLSESEREAVGLIFGLAGYLAHEVHEILPFVLLDSLEAIDAERISTLLNYFSDYAEYLIVALLPEDAAALDGEFTRLTDF